MNATTQMTRYENLSLGHEIGFKNPRRATGLDDKSLDELANDINDNGLTDALHVWSAEIDGKVHEIILRGQRRYLAIGKLIKRRTVRGAELADATPIVYVQCENLKQAELYAAREIVHSSGLSTYEFAEYMSYLRTAHGMTGKEVAKELNKSETWVSRISGAYKSAGEKLRDAWKTGAVPDDTAKLLAEIDAGPKQDEAVDEFLAMRQAGGRRAKGEAKAKAAEKARKDEKAAAKKDEGKNGTHDRQPAKAVTDLLETLSSLKAKHPILIGMLAAIEWDLGILSTAKLPKEFHQALKAHEAEEAKRLKVGHVVTWRSGANGKYTTKKGKIVEVVAAGKSPKLVENTSKRSHESYVVEVEGGEHSHYWPVVSQLKRVEA